ncbi:hypothetical protein [Actinoplanes sp. N902-109]|uniref:hypothetical protein n=1 Tax=Actinoplanes sp. (strain N902-109) TaxID=649831 RepID=UPI000329679B|nr:hypothetical protein [Actinoplanes sp. N902-109]AGL18307.1 hypothetical protein L083_4797 [Actinoplanes sp. N902-109]
MKVREKIMVTAIAGGLTYLLTNATGQPEIWQLTMSVFVGGIVLVVQVLIDFDVALSRFSESVDRRFAQINDATSLFSRVERSRFADEMDRLVRQAANIDADDVVLRRFANYEIGRLSQLFEGLRNGWAFYEGEDRDWLLDLTECAYESIDATSLTSFEAPKGYVDEGQFWLSDLGQRYLARQRRAVNERGVRIRRLFLLDDFSAQDEERVKELVKPHKAIGVQTRILRQSEMDFLIQPDLYDFIVFDGRVSYELRAASTLGPDARPLIASVTLVVDARIANRKERFEALWKDAKDV